MPYKKLIFGILHISNLRPLFMLISTRTGLGYMHGVCQDGSFNIENEFFVRCLASQIFFACLLQCFLLVWLYTKYCVLYLLDCIVWGNRKQLHTHSHAVTVHTHHHISTLPHHTCLPSQSSPFFITIGSRYVILSLLQYLGTKNLQ